MMSGWGNMMGGWGNGGYGLMGMAMPLILGIAIIFLVIYVFGRKKS